MNTSFHQLRSLDTATGAQLDVIGRIVGQERILLNADFYDFFGFQGATKAASFGELGNPGVGGIFYDYGKPLGGNIELDDATYRLFIKAKIFKNTTSSTPEEFLAVLNLVFGTNTIVLTEEGSKIMIDGHVYVCGRYRLIQWASNLMYM